MSSTKWKVGGSVPGYLSLDVEISLGKILNPDGVCSYNKGEGDEKLN